MRAIYTIATIFILLFSVTTLQGVEIADMPAPVATWYKDFQTIDTGITVLQPECKKRKYHTYCNFKTEIKGVTLKLETPIENDELSLSVIFILKGREFTSEDESLANSLLRQAAPLMYHSLGWDSDKTKELMTATTDSINNDLAITDKDDKNVTLKGNFFTGDSRVTNKCYSKLCMTNYRLSIRADAPHLYDENLAKLRTDRELKRRGEELKLTLDAIEKK